MKHNDWIDMETILTIQEVGLGLTFMLTLLAFWLLRDLHKDSKDFYKRNKS